uniref:Uncharacterized protein n=1 Tax=viral metagenome TaxID=1070528 RepID=A0A6M3J7X0_9ZZZZ
MIILDTVGDTIQAEASAASCITISSYGIETASGVDTYKKLGQAQLTGSGTQDILYTVPASTSTVCSVLIIANTSDIMRTVKIWHVPNGQAVGDEYLLFGTVNVKAYTTVVWNKGSVQSFPDMAVEGADHNSLTGLQGGTTNEYYHLTNTQHTNILIGEYIAEYKSLDITR